jgi:hypothetical protein
MTQALDGLRAIDMKHGKAPVNPVHTVPVADSLVRRFLTLGRPVPVVILRFLDRVHGPQPGQSTEDFTRDKLARDIHGGRDFRSLPTPAKHNVLNHEQAIGQNHPYQRAGLDFAQARYILMGSYQALGNASMYPQDVRDGLTDFVSALEKDLSDSAKRNGFYYEYSKQLNSLRDEVLAKDKINTAVRTLQVRENVKLKRRTSGISGTRSAAAQ